MGLPPETDQQYQSNLARTLPGAKMTGALVMRDGHQYLQQPIGTDRFGNPQYAYVATKGGPASDAGAASPADTSIHLTDPGLIARLAQGGGTGMGGVVGANPYGGVLTAPPATPSVNPMLQQFLAQLAARQGGAPPGGPMASGPPTGPAPGPGGVPLFPPATSVGGGSSMPTQTGNGFLSMLQGLRASGAPMSAAPAPAPVAK